MASTMLTRQYFVYVRLSALNYIPCRNLRPVVRKIKSSLFTINFPLPDEAEFFLIKSPSDTFRSDFVWN